MTPKTDKTVRRGRNVAGEQERHHQQVGSAVLFRLLLKDGLLDELRLMVCPVVMGKGKHLCKEGRDRQALELA